jgi:hypothetical protein
LIGSYKNSLDIHFLRYFSLTKLKGFALTHPTLSPTFFNTMTKGLLAALLCTGCLSVASAQTTGFVRGKVLKNVAEACQERQASVKPKGATPEKIESYCTCNATYLADHLTDEQALTMRDNTPPGPPEAMLMAAKKSCVVNLK